MNLFKMEDRTLPKVSIAIGALMDIPTATIITGAKNETIINGGVNALSAVVGKGNSFKSTIVQYMMLSAANRIIKSSPVALHTYDTEVNSVLERFDSFAKRFPNIPDDVIFSESPLWTITDKSRMSGEEWVKKFNENIEYKEKLKAAQITYTALKNPYTKKPLKQLAPTFVAIDSLTDFEPSSTMELADEIIKDDNSTNMRHMNKGRFTDNFLSTLPAKTASSNTYMFLTAQVGDKKDLATGPAKYNQPSKTLQHFNPNEIIKGVSPKFTFLTFAAWYSYSSSVLKNQTTKLPEYPLNNSDSLETDLNIVKLKMLRSKRGSSGYTIELIISQTEGVLPSLTEFHHIKTHKRYGLPGNDRNYRCALRPSVSLSRTTVRKKLNEDPLLRRAINITSEMLQLEKFQPQLRNLGLMCTPEELYEDIKKLGYDWDVLLNTRGYMIPDQYNENELPFLSTIDLLKMRKGLYKPYWM